MHNVLARQSSSFCNRAPLNFQAFALRDAKVEWRDFARECFCFAFVPDFPVYLATPLKALRQRRESLWTELFPIWLSSPRISAPASKKPQLAKPPETMVLGYRCDWLPERARWSHLARSGLPAVSRKQNFNKAI